ncbi:MAG TPA: MFS transporter, partial [Propionibacteriaceae bacterium]|nr:MFS transporter [Propionibacteriaceae bacterium]
MTASETVEQRAEAMAPVSQRRLTVGICINVVAIAFEVIAVATAMPAAARDLDGLPYYAWSFSLFVIGMLFTTVLAGRLSDRMGPARPMVLGMLIFVTGLLLAGSAEHMLQLVGGRLVQGLGSGLMNTAVFVLVAQVYSVTERPRVFAFISTAWVLPSFVGPPVSAWLTEQLSWHWVFYAVVPLVVGGGLLILPTLRRLGRSWTPAERDGEAAAPAPLWAAGVVALAAAALQLAGQRLDWVALGLLVAALAGLAVGLPRLMPACFAQFGRGLPAVILARGLLAGAFVGAEAFVPLMLVEERGVALVLAGAALTVGSVGWTTGSWLQSRPWLGIRRDRLISLGCLSLTLGLAGTALVALMPGLPYYLVAVSWVFAGLGMGLAVSSTGLATMTLSRDAEQGRNGSSLNLSDALGAGLFVGVSGTIFAALRTSVDLSVTFAVVIGTMAVLALLASLTALRIGPVNNEFTSG